MLPMLLNLGDQLSVPAPQEQNDGSPLAGASLPPTAAA